MPKLTFPGGVLIGDTAGFLNVPKIKGTHMAMKSGMVAAEAVFEHLAKDKRRRPKRPSTPSRSRRRWLWDELYQVRNIRPAFKWGLWGALAYGAIDTYVFKGKAPWTLHHHEDHTPARRQERLSEDRLSEAGRQADFRPPVVGLPLEHQPRGKPADVTCT